MHLLADDFDGYGKLIGIVVFGVIWGISALASMVKKANEQARKSAALKAPPTQAQMMQAPALKPAVKQPAVAQKRPPKIPAKAARQPVGRPPAARPAVVARPPASRPAPSPAPPLPPPVAPVVVRQSSLRGAKVAQATISGAGAKPASSGVPGGATAGTIRRWLVPATMRKQFILTELFQPPLALRDHPAPHDTTRF